MNKMAINLSKMKKDIRLLVTGPRWVTSYGVVKVFIDKLFQGLDIERQDYVDKLVFVQGGAKGIDASVKKYALSNGYQQIEFPAKWDDLDDPRGVDVRYNSKGDAYNRLVGFHRNVEMVEYANIAVVFWDKVSKGAAHSFELCSNRMKADQDFLFIPCYLLDKKTLDTLILLFREGLDEGFYSTSDKLAWYNDLDSVQKVQVWDCLDKQERSDFKVLIKLDRSEECLKNVNTQRS